MIELGCFIEKEQGVYCDLFLSFEKKFLLLIFLGSKGEFFIGLNYIK
jgi:hypothetical protein